MNKDQFLAELNADLSAWKFSSSEGMTLEKAKKMAEESVVYSLRMLWLGRYNKLGRERAQALNAACFAYLPESLGYPGAQNGEIILAGQDDTALAKAVFECLWQQYVLSQDLEHLQPAKTPRASILQRLQKFFAGA